MRIKTTHRIVSDRTSAPEHARPSVPLERRGIPQADLVVVQLLFDRVSVPALGDPKSADLRPLTVTVHRLWLSSSASNGWKYLPFRTPLTMMIRATTLRPQHSSGNTEQETMP
jgi:hypothetical protein